GRWVWFFFFQAEDGIRDFHVTGVQTCALPISSGPPRSGRLFSRPIFCRPRKSAGATPPGGGASAGRARIGFRAAATGQAIPTGRSEERRVGKECSSRWPPDR